MRTIGQYTIISRIGEGGMGEVYRAHDPRLDRAVAIKILPASFASDAERLKRFEQEARATSALNHPNILTIYDIGSHEGAPYIVAELLEGSELRDVLQNGPLPQRQAIDYAEQIALGMAAAHDKGILHRDLKPENLFVTTDGRVKILDFGLAKLHPQRSQTTSSEMETNKQLTDPGTVLGTVGYMSPEQVRGHDVDHRSDIFSFGSVLYEMLSGRRAFHRETTAETMTAILREDPQELSDAVVKISTPLEKIVQRCLQKKPDHRFRSAHDLAFALEALSTPSGSRLEATAVAATATVLPARNTAAWIIAAVCLLALLASLPFSIAYFRSTGPASPQPIVRYDITTPEKASLTIIRWPAITMSRDGSTVAFVATADGVTRLYIRRRDDPEPRRLAGTEGAADPAFSPNGKWIAFVADFTLKKVPLDGPAVALTKVDDARGLSWADDDTLVYSPEPADGLFRISANGGTPVQVSKLDAAKNERTHRWPQVLPDGKAVIFTVGTNDSPDSYERSNIEAAVFTTNERRVILQGASMARYVPSGHLVFARGGGLYAVPFDAETLSTSGTPQLVQQGVSGDETTGAAHFAIGDDGTLAYIPGGTGANQRRIAWADRGGKLEPIAIPAAQYNDLRISPDGSRMAVLTGSSGSGDVWVYDLARLTSTRLTFNLSNAAPVWSADGRTVFYSEIQPSGGSVLMQRPADGSRDAQSVTSVTNTAYLKAINRDGTTAIFDYQMNTNRGDIVQVAMKKDAELARLVSTPFNEYAAALSPDGQWLAYQSNESGRPEIYVRDLSQTGGRFPISTDGGEEPRWSADGRELYYRNNASLFSVPIELRPAFRAGKPHALFSGAYDLRSNSGVSYDVDPKTGKFIMIRTADESTLPTSIRVVLNWSEELRRAAPVR